MLDLLEMDQYACGTYRYTRKDVPLDIKTATLRNIDRGEAIFRQHGNLVANVWRDKKLVYVMSTNSSPVMSTCNRKEKDGTVVEVPIPTLTKMYNQYMKGVDHSDQIRSYYSHRLKSRKYYMYLFFIVFECCVTNAFVLQKQYRSAPIKTTKQYRLLLAEKLIGAYTSRHRYGLPQVIQDTALLKSLPPRKRKMAEQSLSH